MTKREAIRACRWVGSQFRDKRTYITHDTKLHHYEAFVKAVGLLGLNHARACAIAGWTARDRELKGGK